MSRRPSSAPQMPSPADGECLHYLCSMYSSLISRWADEAAANQKLESHVSVLEEMLQSEAQCQISARESVECGEEHLKERISALESEYEKAKEHNVEIQVQLTARCGHLQQACAEHSRQVLGQVTLSSQALLRQGEQLSTMREEYTELQVSHRKTQEELSMHRERSQQWRQRSAAFESEAELASIGHKETERCAKVLKDELRQAVRVASRARSREKASTSSAQRGEQALQAKKDRLNAVLREKQSMAKRAYSAERRLEAAEWDRAEIVALRTQHDAQSRALAAAMNEMVQAGHHAKQEAAKSRPPCAREKGDLAVLEASLSKAHRQISELESETCVLHARTEQLHNERLINMSELGSTRQNLFAIHEKWDKADASEQRLAAEVAELRTQCDRQQVLLGDGRRNLCKAEASLKKARTEALEERCARERCHEETKRVTERLRLSQARSHKLNDRVQALEANELRYASRQRLEATRHQLVGPGVGKSSGSRVTAAALTARSPGATPTTWRPSPSPKSVVGTSPLQHRPLPEDKEGIASTKQSFEELPRARAPTQAPALTPAGWGSLATTLLEDKEPNEPPNSDVVASKDAELAVLLEAEPLVLRVPLDPGAIDNRSAAEPRDRWFQGGRKAFSVD